MNIKTLKLSYIAENCYLISTEKSAIVVDPGFDSSDIVDFLKENSHKERLILITHAHFDHIGGAKTASEETGVKIGVGEYDAIGLKDPSVNLSGKFRSKMKPFEADFCYNDGDAFSVGDLEIKVIFTPGHTRGSVCYLINDCLFSGDTLFFESCGRTDFPGGNLGDMKESFYKLVNSLSGSTVVYPGHGEKTTIEHESENNPMGYLSAL